MAGRRSPSASRRRPSPERPAWAGAGAAKRSVAFGKTPTASAKAALVRPASPIPRKYRDGHTPKRARDRSPGSDGSGSPGLFENVDDVMDAFAAGIASKSKPVMVGGSRRSNAVRQPVVVETLEINQAVQDEDKKVMDKINRLMQLATAQLAGAQEAQNEALSLRMRLAEKEAECEMLRTNASQAWSQVQETQNDWTPRATTQAQETLLAELDTLRSKLNKLSGEKPSSIQVEYVCSQCSCVRAQSMLTESTAANGQSMSASLSDTAVTLPAKTLPSASISPPIVKVSRARVLSPGISAGPIMYGSVTGEPVAPLAGSSIAVSAGSDMTTMGPTAKATSSTLPVQTPLGGIAPTSVVIEPGISYLATPGMSIACSSATAPVGPTIVGTNSGGATPQQVTPSMPSRDPLVTQSMIARAIRGDSAVGPVGTTVLEPATTITEKSAVGAYGIGYGSSFMGSFASAATTIPAVVPTRTAPTIERVQTMFSNGAAETTVMDTSYGGTIVNTSYGAPVAYGSPSVPAQYVEAVSAAPSSFVERIVETAAPTAFSSFGPISQILEPAAVAQTVVETVTPATALGATTPVYPAARVLETFPTAQTTYMETITPTPPYSCSAPAFTSVAPTIVEPIPTVPPSYAPIVATMAESVVCDSVLPASYGIPVASTVVETAGPALAVQTTTYGTPVRSGPVIETAGPAFVETIAKASPPMSVAYPPGTAVAMPVMETISGPSNVIEVVPTVAYTSTAAVPSTLLPSPVRNDAGVPLQVTRVPSYCPPVVTTMMPQCFGTPTISTRESRPTTPARLVSSCYESARPGCRTPTLAGRTSRSVSRSASVTRASSVPREGAMSPSTFVRYRRSSSVLQGASTPFCPVQPPHTLTQVRHKTPPVDRNTAILSMYPAEARMQVAPEVEIRGTESLSASAEAPSGDSGRMIGSRSRSVSGSPGREKPEPSAADGGSLTPIRGTGLSETVTPIGGPKNAGTPGRDRVTVMLQPATTPVQFLQQGPATPISPGYMLRSASPAPMSASMRSSSPQAPLVQAPAGSTPGTQLKWKLRWSLEQDDGT